MKRVAKLLLKIQKSQYIPGNIRNSLLSLYGYSIGKGTRIRSDCYFTGENIKIGCNCFINNFCKFYSHLDTESLVELGDNVTVGPNVIFCTHSHNIGETDQRAVRETQLKPIKIGKGTWIGANVLILSGVTIGKGCVIAAGAVVTKDCKDDGLYGGILARILKRLEDDC